MTIKPNRTVEAKYFSLPFSSLIDKYPHLSAFLTSIDPPKFDLGNPSVLSTLNKYLFKEVVDLDVSVPAGFLIPSLGIRHVYCDIINNVIEDENPIIEIGTGSSAALAMILAKKYHRRVVATEINETSIKSAARNIENNGLEYKIEIIQSGGEIIKNIIPKGRYSALVSYPPIYDSDLTKLEKKRGWKGTKSELIGGTRDGLSFSKQLLLESFQIHGVEIDLISIMLMSSVQVKELTSILPAETSYEIIQVNAGTRKRFIFAVSKL